MPRHSPVLPRSPRDPNGAPRNLRTWLMCNFVFGLLDFPGVWGEDGEDGGLAAWGEAFRYDRTGTEVDVNLLVHWYKRAKLMMHFTDENIQLLLKSPRPSSSEDTPKFKPVLPKGIYHHRYRKHLYIYYQSEDGKWHTHSRPVGDHFDQSVADQLVAELLEFRTLHHVPEAEPDAARSDSALDQAPTLEWK